MAGIFGKIGIAALKSRRGRQVPDEGTGQSSMAAAGQPKPGDDDFVGPIRKRDKFMGAIRRGRGRFESNRRKAQERAKKFREGY